MKTTLEGLNEDIHYLRTGFPDFHLTIDPRSGTNTTKAAFHFDGEHVLVQVALCQVSSTSANVSITNVVDVNGETRGIDEFLPCVEVEHAKLVEVTLGTEGIVAVAVATAFFFDQAQ